MTCYFRPIGILSGSVAQAALEQGVALPLAGGPLAFSLVEIVEWIAPGENARRIESAPDWRQQLSVHCASRSRFGGLAEQPLAMGVVNVTPDSFSDGGQFLQTDRAIAQARAQLAAGARIIDIGGELTRPGALEIDPDEEIRRVVPVIAGIRQAADDVGALISIDTRHAETMSAALNAGVSLVNDVSALTHDAAALKVLRDSQAHVVLMHMQGDPLTMQDNPTYNDPALDIYDYLAARIAVCEAAGISRSRILADPGIGFGKTLAHNLALLDQFSLFHGLGVRLMVGASRKGFIGQLSGVASARDRLGGSLAAGLSAVAQGVHILRVHDVPETIQAIKVATAGWG